MIWYYPYSRIAMEEGEVLEEGEIDQDDISSTSAAAASEPVSKKRRTTTTNNLPPAEESISDFIQKKRAELQERVKSQLRLAGVEAKVVEASAADDPQCIEPDSLQLARASKKNAHLKAGTSSSATAHKPPKYYDLDKIDDSEEAMINNWAKRSSKRRDNLDDFVHDDDEHDDPYDDYYGRPSPALDQDYRTPVDMDYRPQVRAGSASDVDNGDEQANEHGDIDERRVARRQRRTAASRSSKLSSDDRRRRRQTGSSDGSDDRSLEGRRPGSNRMRSLRSSDKYSSRRRRRSWSRERPTSKKSSSISNRAARSPKVIDTPYNSIASLREKYSDREKDKNGIPICKFFNEGFCREGNSCPFSHDVQPVRQSDKKQEVCKFYMNGFCRNDERCIFMHAEFPCKFFHKGECIKGNSCRFSHQPLDGVTRPIFERMLQDETSADKVQIPDAPSKRKVLLGSPPRQDGPPQNNFMQGPSQQGNMMGPMNGPNQRGPPPGMMMGGPGGYNPRSMDPMGPMGPGPGGPGPMHNGPGPGGPGPMQNGPGPGPMGGFGPGPGPGPGPMHMSGPGPGPFGMGMPHTNNSMHPMPMPAPPLPPICEFPSDMQQAPNAHPVQQMQSQNHMRSNNFQRSRSSSESSSSSSQSSSSSETEHAASDGPKNLPPVQKELFRRIQKQQKGTKDRSSSAKQNASSSGGANQSAAEPSFDIASMLRQIRAHVTDNASSDASLLSRKQQATGGSWDPLSINTAFSAPTSDSPASPTPENQMPSFLRSALAPQWRLLECTLPLDAKSIPLSVLQASISDQKLACDPRIKKRLTSQFDAVSSLIQQSQRQHDDKTVSNEAAAPANSKDPRLKAKSDTQSIAPTNAAAIGASGQSRDPRLATKQGTNPAVSIDSGQMVSNHSQPLPMMMPSVMVNTQASNIGPMGPLPQLTPLPQPPLLPPFPTMMNSSTGPMMGPGPGPGHGGNNAMNGPMGMGPSNSSPLRAPMMMPNNMPPRPHMNIMGPNMGGPPHPSMNSNGPPPSMGPNGAPGSNAPMWMPQFGGSVPPSAMSSMTNWGPLPAMPQYTGPMPPMNSNAINVAACNFQNSSPSDSNPQRNVIADPRKGSSKHKKKHKKESKGQNQTDSLAVCENLVESSSESASGSPLREKKSNLAIESSPFISAEAVLGEEINLLSEDAQSKHSVYSKSSGIKLKRRSSAEHQE